MEIKINSKMTIKISEVSKYYGTQKALNNISFEIGNGELVGFLGPNGAGKSTMMKIITVWLSHLWESWKHCVKQ